MLRPVRLFRLTVFVHESVLARFLDGLGDMGCVHVDEPTPAERTASDSSWTGERGPDGADRLDGPGEGTPPVEEGDQELDEGSAAGSRGAVSRLGGTGSTYVTEGWIPVDRVDELGELEESLDGLCAWFLDKPELEGYPPTLLDNPGFLGVPELLVRTYGLPSYFEVDPTAIVGVTFPLLFGMVYGDLGHAAMLLLLALIGSRFRERFPEGSTEFLLFLAFTSAVFGALYGEVFGLHYFEPLWFDRIEDVPFRFQVSLVAGLLHVVLGLILAGVNSFLNRRIYRAAYGSL